MPIRSTNTAQGENTAHVTNLQYLKPEKRSI